MTTSKTTKINKRPAKPGRKKTTGTAPTGGGKAPSGPLTGGNGTTAGKPAKKRIEVSAADMSKLRGF